MTGGFCLTAGGDALAGPRETTRDARLGPWQAAKDRGLQVKGYLAHVFFPRVLNRLETPTFHVVSGHSIAFGGREGSESCLLRILISDSAKDEVILHVEGDVTEPGSSELERVVTTLVSESKRVVLELSGVRFVDAHGVDMLHDWRQSVALRNCTLFVNELLKARRSQAQ